MTGKGLPVASMGLSGTNWLVLAAGFVTILVVVMAIILAVSRRKTSLACVAIGVIVSIGLSLGVYALCQRSVHRYLSSATRQVQKRADNRRQVRAILSRCRETRIPSTSVLTSDLGIRDPSVCLYKYSFYDSLNKGNCILVMYNASGGTEMVIPMFGH